MKQSRLITWTFADSEPDIETIDDLNRGFCNTIDHFVEKLYSAIITPLSSANKDEVQNYRIVLLCRNFMRKFRSKGIAKMLVISRTKVKAKAKMSFTTFLFLNLPII